MSGHPPTERIVPTPATGAEPPRPSWIDEVQTAPASETVAQGTLGRLQREIGTAAYGFDETVRLLMVSLLCDSHVLLEGVPGLAKTYLVRRFAQALELPFARIQFTPDMLPSDILGNVTLEQRSGKLEYRPGPIFASVILADEINRAPPKVQSALLEAMQERQVTIDGVSHPLPHPFIVIATQNPIEQEGTYPLPEAQLDRFLFRILLSYPDEATELRMLESRMDADDEGVGRPMLGVAELDRVRSYLSGIYVSSEIVDYLFQVIRQTRRDERIQLGASPRCGLHYLRAVRARALLAGRSYAIPDDVKTLAFPVLNHRLILRPDVLAQQLTTAADGTERSIRALIDSLLSTLNVPR